MSSTPVTKANEHIHRIWIKCRTLFFHNVPGWAKQSLTRLR